MPTAQPAAPAYGLTDSVDQATLQEMQDSFAALAEVSMSICDAEGNLVTRPACAGPLCQLLAVSQSGRAACAHSDEQASRELGDRATKTGPASGNSLHTCHAGMERACVPIHVDGDHLGCIVVGDRPRAAVPQKLAKELARRHGLDEAATIAAAKRIQPWTERQRQATIDCAKTLANALATLCRQDLLLRDRIEELTAIHDIAGLVSGSQDYQEVLDTAARRVTEVVRVKACSIRLLNESTGELVIRAGHNLSQEYLEKEPVLLGNNPIDAAAFAGQTVYIADATADSRVRYPDLAKREGIVSALCTALTCRRQTVGVIRVYTGSRHRFSRFEESLLKSIASQVASAVVNARLYAQRREAQRYQQHLQYAGEIQRRMMPTEPPRHRHITFAGEYSPMLEVGGDLYDFIDLPWGNVGVCVADVVGKGIPAALMMASVRAALRGHAHSILEVNEIISRVNRHLYRDTLTSEFATLFYGVFSPDGTQLTYCNAGHNPPLLLRGDHFEPLETGGMLIGVSPQTLFEKGTLDLEPDDLLVFFTDGVTEALNFEGEAFGQQRLEDSIRRYRNEDAHTLAKQLLWDVRRFTGLAPQADDVTIVVAKVDSAAS